MPACPLGSQSEGLPTLSTFWECLGCCVSCQRCDWQLAASYRGRSACALPCAQPAAACGMCHWASPACWTGTTPSDSSGLCSVSCLWKAPARAAVLVQRRGKEKGMEPLLLWEWAVTPAAVLNWSLWRKPFDTRKLRIDLSCHLGHFLSLKWQCSILIIRMDIVTKVVNIYWSNHLWKRFGLCLGFYFLVGIRGTFMSF